MLSEEMSDFANTLTGVLKPKQSARRTVESVVPLPTTDEQSNEESDDQRSTTSTW